MPKIIGNLKSKILIAAKVRLLNEGYNNLSLRNVAKDCGIAVGTIYNYFPSKDILVGSIMAGDWQNNLDDLKVKCQNETTVIRGFQKIYETIVNFSNVYRDVWSEYALSGKPQNSAYDFHKLLRKQIVSIIDELFSHFSIKTDEAMSAFLAESVLTVAMQNDMDFDILAEVITKIIA